MIQKLKSILYFPLAYYFRFWAEIVLNRWKPRIIVVTGSSGKTTLLHLIESKLQNIAKYSHNANSSYGIPFDILGLKRKSLMKYEWLYLFLLAPFKALSIPKEKIYIVEADCDRPNEGKFLASFLKPEVTLWTNSGITHSTNFDKLTKNSESIEDVIANEFAYFARYTKALLIANGDTLSINNKLQNINVPTKKIYMNILKDYKITQQSTEFYTEKNKFAINSLLPKDTFYSIQMTIELLGYLGIKTDNFFSKYVPAPGRSTVFQGIKNTTIIDSTYNATPDGVRSILKMFVSLDAKEKWIVLGDMIDLGNEEKKEHEKLIDILNSINASKIILVGPRVSKYIYPKLHKSSVQFQMPKEAKDYIIANIKGNETILFKGARFLEGIIEHLLKNKKDAEKLVRREKVWQNRRKIWNL